jgi:hypothetical protein
MALFGPSFEQRRPAVSDTIYSSKKLSITGHPVGMVVLALLSISSLVFVWHGAGRIMRMQTQAASTSEFAELKNEDQAKIVIEISEASEGRIHGRLLAKKDETHYMPTANSVEIRWGKSTAVVMGKAEDVRSGAVVYVTGKVGADHSVEAKQIVVLTGYVQVK